MNHNYCAAWLKEFLAMLPETEKLFFNEMLPMIMDQVKQSQATLRQPLFPQQ